MRLNRSTNSYDIGEAKSPSGRGNYRPKAALVFMEPIRAPDSQHRFIQKFRYASFADAAQQGLVQQVADWEKAIATARWKKYVFDPHASADIDRLTETVEAVLDALAEFGPSVLTLNYLQTQNIHGEHLAALLRVSSTWQNEIAGWNEALNIASDAVSLSGADPKDILFGMI